jgi:hypothetical protein
MTHDPSIPDDVPEEKSAAQGTSFDVLNFLRWLYGDDAPGWLTISTIPQKSDYMSTEWFPGHALRAAARYVERQRNDADVNVGLGLRKEQLKEGRGESQDVLGIPGLWVELDFKHPAHKKVNLPDSLDDLLALLKKAIPLPVSISILSGHGLQGHWLFREPWIFADDQERTAAAHLLRRLQATIKATAALHGWDIDTTSDLARVLRVPDTTNWKIIDQPEPVRVLEAHPNWRYNPHDFDEYLIDVESTSYDQPISEVYAGELQPIDLTALKISPWLKYLIHVGHDPDYVPRDSTRSAMEFKAIQKLIDAGIDDRTIMSLLLDPRYAVSEKPREKGRQWLADELVRAHVKLNGHQRPQTSAPEPEASEPTDEDHQETKGHEAPIHLTDRGNALRLVKAHGQDLHYIYRWKKWLVWDGTRWMVDEGNLVEQLAKRVITQLYQEAKAIIDQLSQSIDDAGEVSDAARKIREQKINAATAVLKWALKSESAERLSGMLRQARSERGIAITPEQLDANPWLLNCTNGTIDLQSGKLHPHRREDLCTKQLTIAYV